MVRPDERQYAVRRFKDKGYSGKDTNRPGFQSLMQDVRRGQVRKVIVYKLDRISRSLIDFVDMMQVFKQHNVEFVSSQELFDTSSPYGEMLMKLLMVFAEFERASIAGRIRDAYDKRSNMGLYAGGRRVYGYNLEEDVIHGVKTKKFVPNAGEAAHIQYIFAAYSRPGVTLRSLQADLLANGIRPLAGTDWTTGKLGTILRNPVYVRADADVYEYYHRRNIRIINDISAFDGRRNIQLYGRSKHDKTLPDLSDMKIVLLESTGLIDSATWLKCQQKLEQNKQIGNALSNGTSWLAGRLMCAKCHHTMTTVKSAARRYFLCTGKTHKKTCSGVQGALYADDLEHMVDRCIAQKLSSLKPARMVRSDQSAAQINALKLKVKEIEGQQAALGEAALRGPLNHEMIRILNGKAETLEHERRGVLKQIDALRASECDVKDNVDFSKKWARANFNEKRAVASVLIKTIIIYEDGTPEIVWNI